MYTLMLKAAVRSNKSVETFVMGTLLDSLIGGGQITVIKGMHVSRLCHPALSQTTTPIFFFTFFCTAEPGLRLTLIREI